MCRGKSFCILLGGSLHRCSEFIDERGEGSGGLLAIRTLRLGRGHACQLVCHYLEI